MVFQKREHFPTSGLRKGKSFPNSEQRSSKNVKVSPLVDSGLPKKGKFPHVLSVQEMKEKGSREELEARKKEASERVASNACHYLKQGFSCHEFEFKFKYVYCRRVVNWYLDPTILQYYTILITNKWFIVVLVLLLLLFFFGSAMLNF